MFPIQFVDRVRILMMPKLCWPKDNAQYAFMQKVAIGRVRLFTGIQLLCLFAVLIVMEIDIVSIFFPILVSS